MLGDNQIDFILRELRSIPHVEIIRIATRMPVTCPMRITEKLSAIIKKYSPVYVMTHFNHINECTGFAQLACQRLVDNGVIVYNQSVLLKGVKILWVRFEIFPVVGSSARDATTYTNAIWPKESSISDSASNGDRDHRGSPWAYEWTCGTSIVRRCSG